MLKIICKIKSIIIPGTISFFSEIWDKKYAIYQLLKRDLVERYIGSYFGLIWVFIAILMLPVMVHLRLVFFRPANNFPFRGMDYHNYHLGLFAEEALKLKIADVKYCLKSN